MTDAVDTTAAEAAVTIPTGEAEAAAVAPKATKRTQKAAPEVAPADRGVLRKFGKTSLYFKG